MPKQGSGGRCLIPIFQIPECLGGRDDGGQVVLASKEKQLGFASPGTQFKISHRKSGSARCLSPFANKIAVNNEDRLEGQIIPPPGKELRLRIVRRGVKMVMDHGHICQFALMRTELSSSSVCCGYTRRVEDGAASS